MFQWLALTTFTAESWVPSLIRELTSTSHAVWPKFKKLNFHFEPLFIIRSYGSQISINSRSVYPVSSEVSCNLERTNAMYALCFPGGSGGKESTCQCRKPGFFPWVGNIPWRREWQPTPVFLPGECHGL